MKNNSDLPHLILAIDAGASSVKVIGSLAGDAECVPFTIEPYCLEIDDQPPANPDFDEDSVWIKLNNVTYAVGNFAVTQYDAHPSIKPAKIDTVIPKVCAAIAIFQQKFKLPREFALSVVSVLPPGEFGWKEAFIERLTLALRKTITTPAGSMKVALRGVAIHPEGYGVMSWHRTVGVAQNRDCAVIMMGFRNTSIFFSQKGQLTNSKSSKHGFYSVLEKIASRAGGNYAERDLALPVWKYLIDKDESGFRRILTSIDTEAEMKMIRSAIETAISEYRGNVEVWLRDNMKPTGLIVVCGGNAEYTFEVLKPFLERYAEDVPGLGSLVKKHIGSTSIPQSLTDTGMATRFLDIYCLWFELNNRYKNTEV